MSVMKELVKITAEKIIYTLETPRDVRKQARQQRREHREPWTTRYFGLVLPMSVQVWRAKGKKQSDQHQHNDNTPGI